VNLHPGRHRPVRPGALRRRHGRCPGYGRQEPFSSNDLRTIIQPQLHLASLAAIGNDVRVQQHPLQWLRLRQMLPSMLIMEAPNC
jgi:hypothetical protein